MCQIIIRLHVGTSIEGNTNYHIDAPEELPLKTWSSVEVSMEDIGTDLFLYRIIVNGEIIHESHQISAGVFEDMKIWASDGYTESSYAELRNIELETPYTGTEIWRGDDSLASFSLRGGNDDAGKYPAEAMFDGKDNNFWHSKDATNNAVSIIFKEKITFIRLKIQVHKNCCNWRYKDVCLYADGAEISCTGTDNPALGSWIEFSNGETVQAANFELVFTNSYAQIAELQIEYENLKECEGNKKMKYWSGKDFPGSDLANVSGVKSIEECTKYCLANSECVAVTYADESTSFKGRCWLKKAQNNWTVKNNPILVSGHKCGYNFSPEITESESGIVDADSIGLNSVIQYSYGNVDCWNSCQWRGGLCENFCGRNGFCCSPGKTHANGDCPTEVVKYMPPSDNGHKCLNVIHSL